MQPPHAHSRRPREGGPDGLLGAVAVREGKNPVVNAGCGCASVGILEVVCIYIHKRLVEQHRICWHHNKARAKYRDNWPWPVGNNDTKGVPLPTMPNEADNSCNYLLEPKS